VIYAKNVSGQISPPYIMNIYFQQYDTIREFENFLLISIIKTATETVKK
jgi:hypothetical protein